MDTGKQAAEVVETDQLLSFNFLFALPIINRERLDQLFAIFLVDIHKKHLLVELSELGSRHDGVLVVPHQGYNGGFAASSLNSVLAAVLFEYFGQVVFDRIVA